MFCRLYAPKNGTDAQGNPTCPPVLAFRGSEFQKDELRSLAVVLNVRAEYVYHSRDGMGRLDEGRTLARSDLFIPIDLGDGWQDSLVEASTIEVPEAENTTSWLRNPLASARDKARQVVDSVTGAVSAAQDVVGIDLLPSDDALPARLQRRLDGLDLANQQHVLVSSGSTRVESLTPAGRLLQRALGYEFRARYNASATLHYDQGGDWGTNVSQAMGIVPDQYLEARRAVDMAVKTAEERGNRLTITGHSLGGGLAQAAALYCHKMYPHIRLKCIHFNAAGLHKETARRVAGAQLSDSRNFPMYAQNVAGELLTAVQTPGTFPLVWNILNWQGVVLPHALGISDCRRGISPGPFPVGGDHTHDFTSPAPPYPNARHPRATVPDGQLLPFVLPINAQNRFTSVNYELVSRPITPRGNQGHVGSGVPAGATPSQITGGHEMNALDMLAPDMQGGITDLRFPDSMLHMEHRTPVPEAFPHMESILGFADAAPTFDAFVGQMVSYLMEQASQNVLDELGDMSLLERLSPVLGLRRAFAGLSSTVDEVKTEAQRMMELVMLSVAYHPMDIGGSTFLRPPREDRQ